MAPTGEVTTHSAETAYNKILAYGGASLYRDDVDARYMSEAENDASTYTGSVTKVKGRIDLVSDVDGYTEKDFPTGSRAANFDTDNDGMPDVWETANGLNPNDASDAKTYTLDSKGYYTNLEVYANALVEDIMRNENADATDSVAEYYPTVNKAEGLDYYSGRLVQRVDTTTTKPITGDKGTLTWPFVSGAAESATLSSNVEKGISASPVVLGSNLSFVGTKNVNGTTETLIQPTEKETSANSDNTITFSFTLKDGYVFQPSNVSFTCSRIGTDGGCIDVAYTTENTSKQALLALVPERNKTPKYYTNYSQTITDVAAAGGTQSLVINLYNLNGGRLAKAIRLYQHRD